MIAAVQVMSLPRRPILTRINTSQGGSRILGRNILGKTNRKQINENLVQLVYAQVENAINKKYEVSRLFSNRLAAGYPRDVQRQH